MHPIDPGLPAHHGGGKQGGTASSASEPGEEPTEDGDVVDERGSEDAGEGRGKDEEQEGEKGAEDEEEYLGGGSGESFLFLSSLWVAMQVACRYFSFFLAILGKGQAGQGRLPRAAGGLREVAADGKREGLHIVDIAMIRQGRMRSVDRHPSRAASPAENRALSHRTTPSIGQRSGRQCRTQTREHLFKCYTGSAKDSAG